MEYVQLRAEVEELKIACLGDLHIGDKNCDMALVRRYISYCLEHGVYIIGMGDVLNVATKDSPGKGPFDQCMSTEEQFDTAVSLLRPLAERGLLIGLLQGNHEERTAKHSGTDLTRMLSSALNVPYLGYSVVIKAVVDRNAYTIYATHGGSNSTTTGGITSRLEKLNDLVDADIFAMGHTHKLLTFTDAIRKVDTRNNKLVDVTRHYIATGAFLDYDGSYGEEKNYGISRKGAPIITLSGQRNHKEITVQLGI